MTKTKSTKHALVMSVMALFLCLTMLLGTTFAWFTDSVTSAGNIIQSGTLDVSMEWLKGTEEPSEDAAWKDASQGAIFDSMLWEPGYTEVRHIKIENEGTLSLKYSVAIQANGVVSELSDAIDVYYIDPAQKIASGDELAADKKIGTLTEVLADLNNTGKGVLEAGEKDTITLALKMREDAGNEYQGLSIGTNFSIVLFATQYTGEFDSFDDQYDANAPKLFTVNGVGYDTAAEAMAAAKDGDKVVLSAVDAPIVIDKAIELTISNTNILADEGVNAITVNADAKIIVDGNNVVTGGKNGDGINVAEGVTLTLTGSGNLVAKGNTGLEYFAHNRLVSDAKVSNTTDEAFAGTGGSGIEAAGNIVIDGLANLTAEGYGKAGFGIGGTTDSIVIKNSTVNYARGGYVGTAMIVPESWSSEVFYGKSDPEGAPAIGSLTDGAVIEISNSTVHKAEGGSKGAGIGARFWTGVTVNITDSTVNAIGGSSSAGIGGSRVDSNAIVDDAVTVNIKNSTVYAVGGDYGAGIGSGYDTYCHKIDEAPANTVNIDTNSIITAQGGLLGAGIGTGHNVIAFTGDIECDVSNVKAGSSADICCLGNPCTTAEDVGLGVYNIKNCSNSVSASASFDDIAKLFAEGGQIYVSEDMTVQDSATNGGTQYITVGGDVALFFADDAKMTFTNTTVLNGTGTVTVYGGSLETGKELCVSGDATLAFEDGEHTFGAFSVANNGSIVVNGGTLNCMGTYGGILGICFGENGSLTVNDGKLNMYQPFNLNQNRCDSAYIEINGGTVELLNGIENLFNVRNVMDKDREEGGTLRGSSIRVNGGTFIAHYEIDSAGDATSFVRNSDSPADTNKVLVSNTADSYDCVVTGGTFYGSWQRADNTRYIDGEGGNSDGQMVENSIAGFVADGYQITGDATNGYVVTAK